ncbi:Lrp/AsnC family transcriptional regulator [Acidovorax sp. Be4]|uniref:Lrp/AsnC family transcriptional regulator n=1 Tax=Acidovorax bellezanensis TaxID=2976702 RepID=A0ABT2PHM9_9BURK|nr:Lrp/AsnC family transcriptional regulator [Acidovorax sp. Be4]MCT9809968.1 Lrp/AsnC family transcriptional regulator [Acidovorax sp. Be4]
MENHRPDGLDFDIIRQLREDGRRPAKTIALALGITEATVTARINALSEASVMRVMAQRNVAHLRTRLFCFIRVWIRDRAAQAVANDIAAFAGAGSVMLMMGSPEIHVTALVEDNDGLLALLQDHIAQVKGVARLDASVTLKAYKYRYDVVSLSPALSLGEPQGDPLDDAIIHQLQLDGRISNREIGRVLDVSASTIRERVNRMLASKQIHIGAVCDYRRIGFEVAAVAYLQVDPRLIKQALVHLMAHKEIGQVSAISGAANLYVIFAARSLEHLFDIVRLKLETVPGVIETSVSLVTQTVKHRADLISLVETPG